MTWLLVGLTLAVLTFVVLELAVRLRIRRRNEWFVRPPYTSVRMDLDGEALPRLDPVAWMNINAEGERGPELPKAADHPGLHRILVAGGSAAECWCLDQDVAWSGRLQALLNSSEARRALNAEHVHVGNVAASGARADTVAWMLEKMLPRYPKLDCLVVLVGGSDVIRWLQMGTPPRVPFDERPADAVFEVNPERRFGWAPSSLALRRVLAHLNRRYQRPVHVRDRAGKTYTRLRQRRQDAERMIDQIPDPAPMVDHFGNHLRRAIEIARAQVGPSLRIVVVKQPWIDRRLTESERRALWNFSVGNPYMEHTTEYYTVRVVKELMRRIDVRADQIATELGVETLDVRSVLDGGEIDYFDFIHYTSAGSKKLAEHLAEHLLSNTASRESKEEGSMV